MPHYTRSTLLAVAAFSSSVLAQTTSAFTPLVSKIYPYTALPYQVDPDNGVRGPQSGYNICNSTTENQQSLCQTMIFNSVDDFCLWAPPTGLTTIGDSEGSEVAWCTKPGHGSRLIPAGAIKGVQFMKTSDYVQVVGFIDQTEINLLSNDTGGELDPHGADLRGNPIGAMVYSNAFNATGLNQVIEWHNFMGGNMFCLKICDPSRPHAAEFCHNIFDRIGCAYNAPNNAQNGSFTSCDGDTQDYPGVYTDSAGVVQTYTQPAESLGPISSMPYQPKVPASSNCITYTSASLFAANTQTPSGTPSSSVSGSHLSSVKGSSSTPTRTGTSSTAISSGSSGASGLTVSSISTLLGVVLAVTFLA